MFHTIIVAGNVGKDPEMRYTPSGQAVTSFSVAKMCIRDRYNAFQGLYLHCQLRLLYETWDFLLEG